MPKTIKDAESDATRTDSENADAAREKLKEEAGKGLRRINRDIEEDGK
ncbi:hypothetical protein [Agrobacterium rosae]